MGLGEFGADSELWPLSVLLTPWIPVAAVVSSSTAASPEQLCLIPAFPKNSDRLK